MSGCAAQSKNELHIVAETHLSRIYSTAREVFIMERKCNQVELSDFVSVETDYRPSSFYPKRKTHESRAHHTGWGKKRSSRKAAQKQPFDATSMLIKCGICAAACALVLLLKWIGTPATDKALQTVNEAVNEDSELDEMLGKLQFVELPGILEVFSSSGKLQLPINASQAQSAQDDTLLALTSESEQYVIACMDGSVKETGLDQELGSYVRIASTDDMDLYFYGLSGVSVEVGQPLLESDYVGSIKAGDTLYVSLFVKGKPENPAGYFSLPAENV